MREIKFRQWDKSTKSFHYWGYITEHGLEKRYGKYFQSPLGPMDDDLRESQQFTGLFDKNGREIYEGDILENKGFHNLRCFIEWDEKRGCWPYYAPREKFEIIGNIYENPELLEDEEK